VVKEESDRKRVKREQRSREPDEKHVGLVVQYVKEKGEGLIFGDNGVQYTGKSAEIVADGVKGLRPYTRVRFFTERRAKWNAPATKITAENGDPIQFTHPHEEALDDLPPIDRAIMDRRVRGMVWVWKLRKKRGWLLPLPPDKWAPISVRAENVVAKGDKNLREWAVVDFYVQMHDGHPMAVQVGAPCDVPKRVKPVIFEIGEERGHIVKYGEKPRKERKQFGLVRKWDQERGTGVIVPEDGSRNFRFLEENVVWTNGAEKKVPLWIRVQYSMIKKEGGHREAIRVSLANGNPIGKRKQECLVVGQRRHDTETFFEMETIPAPSPPRDRGRVRTGTVLSWNKDEQRGIIDSRSKGMVTALMSEVQSEEDPICLETGREVEFYYDKGMAYHITAPGNFMYSNAEAPTRDPIKSGRYVCVLCNLSLSSQITLDTHLVGKAHRKRLEQQKMNKVLPKKRALTDLEKRRREWEGEMVEELPGTVYVDPSSPFFCPYCITELENQREYTVHCRSESHKHQERLHGGRVVTILPQLPTGFLYRCKCCNKKMLTGGNWDKHIRGKQHKHKSAMSRLNYQSCDLCDVEFTSAHHMRDHFTGKRHRSAVRDNDGEDPHEDWAKGMESELMNDPRQYATTNTRYEYVDPIERKKVKSWDEMDDWRMDAPMLDYGGGGGGCGGYRRRRSGW